MAYTPTTWTTGDTITTSKLNKIEQGIAGAGGCFLVGYDTNNAMALDKTWQEIVDAVKSGKLPILYWENTNDIGNNMYEYHGEIKFFENWNHREDSLTPYSITFVNDGNGSSSFTASSPTDYPVLHVNVPVT